MKKRLISVVLALALVVSLVAAACAAPKPTSTPRPTPVPTPTMGITPTPITGATPMPTPTRGVTPTAIPTSTPTIAATPVSGATVTPTSAQPPEKVYKWLFVTPLTRTANPEWIMLMERIEELSKGRLKIEISEKGQHPYKEADLLDVVGHRLAEVAYNTEMYVGAVDPKPGWQRLPFIEAGSTVEERYWLQEQLYNDIWKPLLDKNNQVMLAQQFTPDMSISARVPATSYESVKGYTVRAPGKEMAQTVEAIGFKSANLDWGEVYTGLQRGIIDGVWVSIVTPYRSKFYEIIKYVTMIPGAMPTTLSAMVNKDALNELPPDLQDAIRGSFAEWRKWMSEFMKQGDSLAAYNAVAEYGVTLVRMPQPMMDEVATKVEGIWNDWAARVGPQGPDLLKKIKSLRQEWAATHK